MLSPEFVFIAEACFEIFVNKSKKSCLYAKVLKIITKFVTNRKESVIE
jgi:hypothetical protein